jgi:hypothetical protein
MLLKNASCPGRAALKNAKPLSQLGLYRGVSSIRFGTQDGLRHQIGTPLPLQVNSTVHTNSKGNKRVFKPLRAQEVTQAPQVPQGSANSPSGLCFTSRAHTATGSA